MLQALPSGVTRDHGKMCQVLAGGQLERDAVGLGLFAVARQLAFCPEQLASAAYVLCWAKYANSVALISPSLAFTHPAGWQLFGAGHRPRLRA